MINSIKSRRSFLQGALKVSTLGGLVMSTSLLSAGCAQYIDAPRDVVPMILREAELTLNTFRSIPDLAVIDELIPDAAGIIIFPRVIKGGVIAGLEVGTGVMLMRNGSQWSYPAFYMLSAGSVGLQLGLQETQIVMIIRNRQALNSIIEHQGKIGAEMGIMVGWAGIGYEGATTTNLGADIIAFTGPGFGLFGGVALEGAALIRRTDMNEYLYGPGATPQNIVLDGTRTNRLADRLRGAINPD